MSRLVIAMFWALSLCSTSNAADFTDAVVNFSGCSGTVISVGKDHAMILSAAHCFNKGAVHDFTAGEGRYTAKVVDVDKKFDLALLRTTTAHGMGTFSPVALDGGNWPYIAAGYPGGGPLKVKLLAGGKVNQRYNPSKGAWDNFFIVEKGYFNGGDSGGGVFNGQGQLVGVITHSEERCDRRGCNQLYATKQTRIFDFLKRNKGKYEGCGQYCPAPGDEPDPEIPPHKQPNLNSNKDRSREIAALQKQVELLVSELDKIKNREVAPPVPIPDPEDGAKGDDGKQGEVGPQGIAGANGTDGQSGESGPQGVTGVITVVITRNGVVTRTIDDVVSGSNVNVKILEEE